LLLYVLFFFKGLGFYDFRVSIFFSCVRFGANNGKTTWVFCERNDLKIFKRIEELEHMFKKKIKKSQISVEIIEIEES
jgi:hypothetical protein